MTNIQIINFTLQFFGSALSLVVIICLLMTYRNKTKSDRLYLAMLLSNMGAMVMEMLALYFRGKLGSVPWFFVRATNYSQFVFSNILTFVFLGYLQNYIETVIKKKLSKRYMYTGIVGLSFGIIILTVNLFYPFIYEIGEDNLYRRLPLYPIIFLPILISAIAAGCILYSNRNRLKWEVAASFAVYIMIPFLSIIISVFVYGIAVGYMGTTLVLTGVFLYLQLEQSQRLAELSTEKAVYKVKESENLVNSCIREAMSSEDPEENITLLLSSLGEKLNLRRIWITEDSKNSKGVNSYEWKSEEDDSEQIPDKESSDRLEFIRFPLVYNGDEIGAFHLEQVTEKELIVSNDILEITSSFLVTLINKRDTLRELQNLSLTDSGTGVGNRYAMYSHFKSLKNKENIGVVYGDITGLKKVNDEEGHEAGDRLIKNSCEAFSAGFKHNEIFRIGGDEFVILSSGLTKEKFESKINMVRGKLKELNIIVAIGSEFLPRVKDTVEQTIAEAEIRMYQEKNNWYRNSGVDRRK